MSSRSGSRVFVWIGILHCFMLLILVVRSEDGPVTNVGVTDEYVRKTEKTREELIDTGYYFPSNTFGSFKTDSREARSLEYYVPPSSKDVNVGWWPEGFEVRLRRMRKRTLRLVKFVLHTKNTPGALALDGEPLNPSDLTSVSRSTWNTSETLKILIHGYRQDVKTKNMPQQLKDAYLSMNRTDNLLLVDWGALSNEPNYFQSAMYSQKVGRYLGDFLIRLRNGRLLLNFYDVHIIGFGLGAQAAAAAADYMKARAGGLPTIGRITGLDPAQPGFEARESLYLDEQDAAFVDIIHSNGGNNFLNGEFGVTRALGHMDFYPNGGVQQPICGDYGAIRDLISACHHWKAPDYYKRSIEGELFKACKCNSWGEFDAESCSCAIGHFMGEYLIPASYGKYYLHVFEYTLFELLQQMNT